LLLETSKSKSALAVLYVIFMESETLYKSLKDGLIDDLTPECQSKILNWLHIKLDICSRMIQSTIQKCSKYFLISNQYDTVMAYLESEKTLILNLAATLPLVE
jgi:hypothetical protein